MLQHYQIYGIIICRNFNLELEEKLSSEEEKVTKLNSSVSQLKQRVEELLVSVQTEQERTRLAGEEKMKLVRITNWYAT